MTKWCPDPACLGSLLVLAVAVDACNSASKQPAPERPLALDAGTNANVAIPVLAVAEPEFGFGSVVVGQSKEHAFLLKNNGTAPLVIDDVSASCGCTVTQLAERQIAPGASTQLNTHYRPVSITGPDHQTIRLRTNDPAHREFELSIRAMVVPEIRFEPAIVRFFTDSDSTKPVVAKLVGPVVIRANLHLAELRGEKAAIAQIDAKAVARPYDTRHQPELHVALKRGHLPSGKVYAVVLTGLPDPTQINVPIEWGTQRELTTPPVVQRPGPGPSPSP